MTMTNLKTSKKEAIEALRLKMNDCFKKGDIAGIASCKAQIDTIRATNVGNGNGQR